MCGNCCRQGWYVPIFKEDLLKWKKNDKIDIFKKIQVDPRKISIIGLNNHSWKSEWEENFIAYVKAHPEECSEITDFPKAHNIYDFLLENHEYIEEGNNRKHPALGDIYKFPEPYGWEWPIFIPKDFGTIFKGMKLGISYLAITDLTGDCEFLENGLCSIHKLKPLACELFPYRRIEGKWELSLFPKFMKVCKGLKKQKY
jgi:Fe-S-cluster containining protein